MLIERHLVLAGAVRQLCSVVVLAELRCRDLAMRDAVI